MSASAGTNRKYAHPQSDVSELIKMNETTQKVVLDRYFRDSTKIKSTLQKLRDGFYFDGHSSSKDKLVKPKPHIIYMDDSNSYLVIEKKKKKKAKVLLKDIKSVVTGTSFSETGVFHKYLEALQSKKKELPFHIDWTVAISYGTSGEQLDMAFKKVDDFISLLVALNYLLRSCHLSEAPPMSVVMLRYWMYADENNDNKLSLQEVQKLFKKLNIQINSSYLKRNYERFDTDKSGTIEFNEFIEMFKEMHVIEEIEDAFIDATKTNLMTVSEFQQFMQLKQDQYISKEEATELMKKNGGIENENGEICIPSFEFTSFILSNDNSVVSPEFYSLNHDMDFPLTQYFISSSHNTYLSGHQLKGESDVKNYRNGLLNGSRCVELDCWNGDNGEVVVYHGRTLTSKILFEDVIKCINEVSFVNSPYPVILSLDVHADIAGQEKMADIMVRIFGDKLLLPDYNMTMWPSPNQLKNKIIIKNKKVPGSSQSVTSPVDSDSDSEDDEDEVAAQKEEHPVKQKHPKVKVAQKLSDITALGTTKFSTFSEAMKLPCYRMFSISEGKVNKLVASDCASLIKYNQNHFSRSYPHGLRFDSSNYDPTPSFISGVQMSALNTQTHCNFFRMNEFRFRENGMCGYVLKHKMLRGDTEEEKNSRTSFTKVVEIPNEKSPIKQKLTVKIIMGKQIPKPKGATKGDIVDPYVKLTILGLSQDSNSQSTNTIWNNGWNPLWNETFEFDLVCPELAWLQVSVWDKNKLSSDTFICENCFPVSSMRTGCLRSIPLFDEDMNSIEGGFILCNVKLTH